MEEELYRIYALVDPDDLLVGYVGVTTQMLDKRLNQHISEAAAGKGGAKKHEWLEDILQSGAYPIIVELDRCYSAEWEAREQFWISLFRSRGYDLTNTTEGGAGQPGLIHTEETKARIAESVSRARSGSGG